MKKILTYITFALCIIATLSGCSEKLSEWWNNDAPDMTGEEIVFTSQLPAVVKTTTRATSVDNELLHGYKPVSEKYEFSISMFKEGEYNAIKSATYGSIDNNNDGDLESTAPLHWQDNVNKYGFEATAGTQSLEAEQNTKEKWLKQDLLKGYGYEPLIETTGEGESSTSNKIDKIDALNYRTNKEWYNANKTWKDQNGISSSDEYKKIPLFLQHQRALITVILKAGEGVDRKDVLASTASQKIATKIYSYDDSQQEESQKKLEITPLQGTATVDYDKIGNLPAETNVEVARYDAIVMPHDYFTNAEDEKICAINVANQNFSFYASNDSRYGKKEELSESGKKEFEDAYNLQAGDNLVITATLSRDSRKILMTAYVQPWTDVITSYVCDDFGSTGDPIIIDNREQLEAFLKNKEKNASGYVAVLNTNLTLDDWTLSKDLNAILNLGNHTITTDNILFNNITASGSLINGNIKVKNNSTSDVKTVICNTNKGLIDHINITNDDDHNPAVVSRAAIAITNHGYISSCSSAVKVMGKATAEGEEIFIGGIAAESKKAKSAGMLSVINNCTVTGKVDAQESTTVKCGGIVGNANGYVMNNTYEYGVTLNQETMRTDYFKNIVHTKANDIEGVSLIATGNQWPTKTPNTPNNNNVAIDNTRAEHKLFDRVIDCQNELGKLVEANSNYNDVKYSYRIADNFTVSSDTWELGKKSDETNNTNAKNVLFTLDGNNKAITLDGTKKIYYKDKKSEADDDSEANITAPMLFANITGTVKNLTLLCKQSLYGIPEYADGDDGNNMSSDICAPLAYAVVGGTISNIKVHAVPYTDSEGKMVYPKVVAALPSGLVTWAYKGATIENCTSDIDVEMRLASNYDNKDKKLFAGGLLSQVANAIITQCKYAPRDDYKFTCNKTATVFFGGIVGGTVIKDVSGEGKKYNPNVTISDCASWYKGSGSYTIGSIIGRPYYDNGKNENVDGVNKTACQGNWWPSGITGVGTASALGGDEKIIGKKSSVNPNKPVFD